VQIAKNYQKSCGFLRFKRKVMVFRNLASNVVVLCSQLGSFAGAIHPQDVAA
jgi:hypothetical protein